jgi:hypothetical protein
MNDLLFLNDRNRCPVCFVRRNGSNDGSCHNCGVRLFPSVNYDFKRFEDETPIRFWWAYDVRSGWKHRDHFMVVNARLQERHQASIKLDKDYGRKTTPAEVAARGGKLERTIKRG